MYKFLNKILNGLDMVVESFRDYKDYHKTYRELNALDDRELHDLGMHRSDISRIAAKKAVCHK